MASNDDKDSNGLPIRRRKQAHVMQPLELLEMLRCNSLDEEGTESQADAYCKISAPAKMQTSDEQLNRCKSPNSGIHIRKGDIDFYTVSSLSPKVRNRLKKATDGRRSPSRETLRLPEPSKDLRKSINGVRSHPKEVLDERRSRSRSTDTIDEHLTSSHELLRSPEPPKKDPRKSANSVRSQPKEALDERRSRSRSMNTYPASYYTERNVEATHTTSRIKSASRVWERKKSASVNPAKQRLSNTKELVANEECDKTGGVVHETRYKMPARKAKSLVDAPCIGELEIESPRDRCYSVAGYHPNYDPLPSLVHQIELDDPAWSRHWCFARHVMLKNVDEIDSNGQFPQWKFDALLPPINKPMTVRKPTEEETPEKNVSLEERLARIEKEQGIDHRRKISYHL